MKAFLGLIFFLLMPQLGMAKEQSMIVIVPVQVDGLPPVVASKYEGILRKEAAKHGQLISADATVGVLASAGKRADCGTKECGLAIAKSANARFVVSTRVVGADEIYTVTINVDDAALGKRVSTGKAECELCAVEEVTASVSEAFGQVTKSLDTPAPAKKKKKKKKRKKKKKKKKKNKVKVEVRTVPSGAKVFVNKKSKGKSPSIFMVKAGEHTLRVVKDGYAVDEKRFSALDKTVKLDIKLKRPAPDIVDIDKGPGMTIQAPKSSADPAYYGAVWGLGLGGAAVAGLGGWLIILDGTVTCSDGRGLRDCPTLYNTKGLGMIAFGLGSASIGAGLGILINEFIKESKKLEGAADDQAGASIFVQPVIDGRSTGLGLSGSF